MTASLHRTFNHYGCTFHNPEADLTSIFRSVTLMISWKGSSGFHNLISGNGRTEIIASARLEDFLT